MMDPLPQRLFPRPDTDAAAGSVRVSPAKAAWFLGHLALAVLVAPWFVSPSAVLVSAALTAITLCCGHSVGLHRLLIHRSFRCPRWVELILVYLGVLVGMGGPFGMLYLHEIRDWAQKEPRSHPFFGHGKTWWIDAWWQLCCEIELDRHPKFRPEPEVAKDPLYRFLQSTWMAQQLPIALVLGLLGGVGWVLWGVSVRIVVSLVGHWLIGHLAHNRGRERWRVEGASVQGYNLPGTGVITMGEGWHNNHHAFPRSARLGHAGQADPGWWFVCALERLGLASDLCIPESLPIRPELQELQRGPNRGASNHPSAGRPTHQARS